MIGIINLLILVVILIVGLWPFNFWPQNKVEWLKERNGVHFYGQGIIYSQEPMEDGKLGRWEDGEEHTKGPMELWNSGIVEKWRMKSTKPTSHKTDQTKNQGTVFPETTLPIFQPSNIPGFSILLWLQPDTEPHSLPHIFSLLGGQETEPFFIGQWKSSLILRTRMPDPTRSRPYREIGLRNALLKGKESFIAVTSDESGTSIFLNGKMERAYPNHILIPKGQISSYHIILGNSAAGKGYWKGNLFRLAVYDRALTGEEILRHFEDGLRTDRPSPLNEEGLITLYTFGERSGARIQDHIGGHHLRLPQRFETLRRDILTSPRVDFSFSWSYLKDVIINVLGFIPFGFFLSAYLHEKRIRSKSLPLFISIFLGACLSLMIELLQAYLPTRSSQMTDLLTNIFGALMGAAFYGFLVISSHSARAKDR